MSNHLTNQLRNWSPGQAMLPPDPCGHNRALDRVAAEHLREVAPGLAPQPERTAETCCCGHCESERDRRAQPPAPPAEATGEMSREEFAKHGSAMLLLVLQDARPRYDEFVRHFNAIAECDAALRTRAREAEEQEAKWRRELSAACELSERAREIVVSALNQPPEHFYDKHDNGEWSAEHIAFAIRSLFRERDEAREQLAKETERADKEYERCELWKRTTDDVAMERDALRTNLATERAARVKAEEYKDRLRGECVGTLTDVGAYMLVDSDPTAPGEVASAIRRVARELDQNAARLAAAEARIARLVEVLDALHYDESGHIDQWPTAASWAAAKETK